MKTVFVASESAPYIKTGGLGDVVHSLAKVLTKLGHAIYVIMPKYKTIKGDLRECASAKVYFDQRWISYKVYEDIKDHVRYYFIEYEEYYGREYPYGSPKGAYEDNALRFGFLSLASLETVRTLKIEPDIFHIHDWHTGLLPLYKNLYYKEWDRVPVVFSIHNAMHQGIFDAQFLPLLNLPWDVFRPFDGIEFYGKLNFMKAGITFCDLLTTVSPSYAEELKSYAYGLEGLIREKKYFFGVLNGIDYDVWNPEEDKLIRHNYGVKNFQKGKRLNKRDVKAIFGLKSSNDRPLVGMVSRLTAQKGLDLVQGIMDEGVRESFDFVFLGSGEEKYQNMLIDFMKRYPESVRVRIEYNEELAHMVYAGADIFLMPSLFEPCGISQMIAMRYGTVPVARKVGGLKDTVIDYMEFPQSGVGFTFEEYSSKELMRALLRARIYYDMYICDSGKEWQEIIKRSMKRDFSWERSAREYERLYTTALMLRKYGS